MARRTNAELNPAGNALCIQLNYIGVDASPIKDL